MVLISNYLRTDDRFDTADTAAGAFFFLNFEALEFGSISRMRSAANFLADIADGVYFDAFTVAVTEKTDWSWRYDCTGWQFGTEKGTGSSAQITLEPRGNRITFTNVRSESQWLDGDSWCDNEFGQPNNG